MYKLFIAFVIIFFIDNPSDTTKVKQDTMKARQMTIFAQQDLEAEIDSLDDKLDKILKFLNDTIK